MDFEREREPLIFELRKRLVSRQYRHGPYAAFTIHDPKQRSIHKALVMDRLVHQAVVQVVEPLFEKQFIFDSYSCRKGKGVHAALRRLQHFLRAASRNNGRTVYALKCDIRKFFDSVDHVVLHRLLAQRVADPDVLRLMREITGSFSKTPGKGLPLGNVTSQLFANVYLHPLDHFVKHRLRVKQYLRYCDDFIIVAEDRAALWSLVPPIAHFLETRLQLELHPQKMSVRSWQQGIDFVGYVSKPRCTLLRSKTRRRMLKLANARNLPSYLGVCSHADAYEVATLLLNQVDPLD